MGIMEPTFSIEHKAVLDIKKLYPDNWKTIITDLIESNIETADLLNIKVNDIVVLTSGSPYLVVTEITKKSSDRKIIKCVQESDNTIVHELEDHMFIKLTKDRSIF